MVCINMRTYIDTIVDYIGFKTDASKYFTKSLVVQLFGHLLSKKSKVFITPEVEYLNLYIMLIGESFYARKSAIQDMVMDLYPKDKLLPNESSAEKFIANLEEIPDGVWSYGEFSKILKHIKKGSYLSSIAETLNDLYKYDRREYKRELMKDEYVIINPYPTFNTTLTPEVLMEQVTPEMMEGGLFGRLIMVPSVESERKIKPRDNLPKELFKIKCNLKRNIEVLSDMNLKVNFTFDDSGFKTINDIEEKLSHNGARAIAGRYGQAIIKISAIIAFGEELYNKQVLHKIHKISKINQINKIHKIHSQESSTDMRVVASEASCELCDFVNFVNFVNFEIKIRSEHVMEAYDLVKPGIEFANNLIDYSKMNKPYIIKAREYIKENYPCNRSDVMRAKHLDSRQIKEAETTLIEQGIIIRTTYNYKRSDGKMSKPKTIYCLTSVDKNKCDNCKYKIECKKSGNI
jgi:hypothetical protein